MAYTTVIQDYYKGQIAIIGNALSIGSGGASYSGDSFSTLTNTRTPNYLLNGATAEFNMPPGSTIAYAEIQFGTAGNVTSDVTFSTPATTTILSGASFTAYPGAAGLRYRDVTSLIQQGGSGVYSVQNVEGSNAFLLWSIFIIYENPIYDLNYIYYARANDIVLNATTTTVFNNIYTPASGPIKAYLLRTSGASDTVDQTSFTINGNPVGNTSNPWNGLSPYNPASNVLPGIICVANPHEPNLGLLDTRGTFGNDNINPYTNVRPNPCRAYVDIAGFDISSTLTNNQSTATLVEIAPGGGYYSWMLAFQVNAQLPQLVPTKYVDKNQSFNGDELLYTCVFTNSGNYTATNIILVDTLPAGTTFVSNSLTLNGAVQSGISPTPPTGASLGMLLPNETATVTFKINVVSVAVNTTINNRYYLGYKNTPAVFSALSNTVPTYIAPISFTSSKSVDKNYATVSDELNYSIRINYNGADSLNNVILVDTLPVGTSFVPNSVTINNISVSGSPESPGLAISSIAANSITTVGFKVIVTTFPNINPLANNAYISASLQSSPLESITNNAVTTINYSNLFSTKYVNKAYGVIGTVLNYIITLENHGNTTANNILFLDTIPNGTSLVTDSFKQDGIVITGTPNTSTTLPNNLKAGGVTTVTFQVIVTTVPVPNPILNTATATSSFTVDSTTTPNRVGTTSTNTNAVTTKVNFASLTGITKYTDKIYSTCGDSINYTIVIPNSGNVTAQYIIIKDTIPNGTVLNPTSIYVNGVQQLGANPLAGITIPNLAPGTTATLTFSVKVQC